MIKENQFSRTQLSYGKEAMNKLQNSHVAIFGLGGVGGYVGEALVRSGIGSFNLIDDDRIKVDLMGACDGMLGAEIWFEIENKKDYPIKIQSRDMSVNGYMENTIMSVDVMPGMKAKDRMIFSNINSIDDLVGVQGKLWLINNNDVSNSGTYDIVIN